MLTHCTRKQKRRIVGLGLLLALSWACSVKVPITPTLLPVTVHVATMTATPVPTPEFVWAWNGSDNDVDPPTILTMRNGTPAYAPIGVKVHQFWDYSNFSGRLVYTADYETRDLWVYDYQTGQAEQWMVNNVCFTAVWSHGINPTTGKELLAVARRDQRDDCSEIVILSDATTVVAMISDASLHFAWSPDAESLVYHKGLHDGVYIVTVPGAEATKIASFFTSSSVYELPVWATEHQAVFYIEGGYITCAWLDGSGSFQPSLEGKRIGHTSQQYAMLWSPQKRALILAGEGSMGPPKVLVYELSEDLQTTINEYTLAEDVIMAGWYTYGESVILLRDNHRGEPEIVPLR